MVTVIAAIVGPLAAALSGYGVWRLQRLHRDNNSQHESNWKLLQTIHNDVQDVGGKVDSVASKVDKHHRRLTKLEKK
jgi:peptidoglycan hydrolase CwlO-like protein